MMHTHRHFFLLQPVFYLLCLLGLSSQPLYADSYRCPLAHLTADVPIALVIANSQYESGTLWQSVNDANAMDNVLKKLDFQVIFKTELNRKAMNQAIAQFSHCLQTTGGVGLFYFTGYGVQVKAENYLLPINADIKDEIDVEFEAFPVNELLARLQKTQNALNIMILDASRENPYLPFSSRGLAEMLPPSDFFMGYPAEPGKTVVKESGARNSLYIRALSKVLAMAKQNHTRIEDVFMQVTNMVERDSQRLQVPHKHNALKETFCFGGCSDVALSTGMNRDYTVAMNPFRQAAEQAPVEAQNHLGLSSYRCQLAYPTADVPIALVIANSQYQKRRLWQQINDANAMNKVLTELGFQVIFKTELNRKSMNQVIAEFSHCLQTTGGVGLFYFTGYGVQVKAGKYQAENYLLPINGDIKYEIDVEFEAFPVNKILARLQKTQNALNIMILDASRENPSLPFSRRGLAEMSPPSGFLIGYPTELGKTVRKGWTKNSLYIRALSKALVTAKHTRIEDVFMLVTQAVERESHRQQAPQYHTALIEKFCFGGCLDVFFSTGVGAYNKGDYMTALKWFRQAAEQGHANAQKHLGVMYAKGQGVVKNNRKAIEWLEKAAKQGFAKAQYNLGVAYAKGLGVSQNNQEAVKRFQQAAEQGDAYAQYNLGVMYDNGRGVPQNEQTAFQWYQKAAKRGHAQAQFVLGLRYDNGRGVPQNDREAFNWYKKAAEQGLADAQYNLGVMYYNGQYINQNDSEALKWFKKAAKQGHAEAREQLRELSSKHRVLER